ncbi:MAG: T9SS type A sorting domain-containing protein [Salibacteraceae bacterium]|nr:T9SS type A sorting domain-containing protein [Salibacteraceae bacterium]
MNKIILLFALFTISQNAISQITDPAPYCKSIFENNYNSIENIIMKGKAVEFGQAGKLGTFNTYQYYNNLSFPDFVIGDTASIDLSFYSVAYIEPIYFALWIDYNKNDIFDESELVLENSNSIKSKLPVFADPAVTSKSIIRVPTTALAGKTRARLIRGQNDVNPFATYDSSFSLDPCPVKFRFNHGCTYDFDINLTKNTIDSTVGIIENDFSDNILLYPNPTNGDFSIDLREEFLSATVTITDLNGKFIQANKYENDQLLKLNLEAPIGIYFLTIETEDKKTQIQIIKK